MNDDFKVAGGVELKTADLVAEVQVLLELNRIEIECQRNLQGQVAADQTTGYLDLIEKVNAGRLAEFVYQVLECGKLKFRAAQQAGQLAVQRGAMRDGKGRIAEVRILIQAHVIANGKPARVY